MPDAQDDRLADALFKVVRILDPECDADTLVAGALEPARYDPPAATEIEPDEWSIGIGNTFA